MKHYLVALLCGLLTFGLGTSARADKENEERAAHLAVRWVIQHNLGTSRVFFTETKSQFLSFSESKITGEGYLTRSGSWDSDRFTYSVKVRRSDYQTRDVEVKLSNGTIYEDHIEWTKPTGGENYIGYFTSPDRFRDYPAGNVTFSGVLRVPAADIRIYDNRGTLIAQKRVSERNGRFSTTHRLGSGLYRAVLGNARMADSDEVRFSVSYSDDVDWWGGGGILPGPPGFDRVSITYPRNNATLNTSRAEIQGTSNERDVNVKVYDSSNRLRHNTTIAVRNGRWSTSVSLSNGRYRVVAENMSGRDKDEIWFNFVGGSGGGGSDEDRVRITYPSNNANIGTMRVDIQGTSTERDVQVEVFDASGRRILNNKIAVSGGRWSTYLNPPNGRYRIVAKAASGRDTDEIWFTRSNGSGGSNEDRVVITYPKSGATVGTMRVDIQGTSTESDVQVEVFDSKGKRVHYVKIAVRNGRWSTNLNIPDGRYRIKARSGSGRDTDEQWFTRTNSNMPSPRGG